MYISLFLGHVQVITQGGWQVYIQYNNTSSRCPFFLSKAAEQRWWLSLQDSTGSSNHILILAAA